MAGFPATRLDGFDINQRDTKTMGTLQSELATKILAAPPSADTPAPPPKPKTVKASKKSARLKKTEIVVAAAANATAAAEAAIAMQTAITDGKAFVVDDSVDGIMIQVSGQIGRTVRNSCGWIFVSTTESLAEREARKAPGRANGVQIIAPTREVDMLQFVRDLAERGWELVDATAQDRERPEKKGSYYCCVRFIFRYHMNISAEEYAYFARPKVHEQRRAVQELLKQFAGLGAWRVRGFKNPLAEKDGSSRFGLSLNLDNFELVPDPGKPATSRLRFEGKVISVVPAA